MQKKYIRDSQRLLIKKFKKWLFGKEYQKWFDNRIEQIVEEWLEKHGDTITYTIYDNYKTTEYTEKSVEEAYDYAYEHILEELDKEVDCNYLVEY